MPIEIKTPDGVEPAAQSQAEPAAANAHTPGPWEVVEATEHHGWYVTSDFGNTICDLYCMSRPDLPSTINGGISHPVPFMHEMDGPNARLIAIAPELYEYVESSASNGCATAQLLIAKARGVAK